MVAGGSKNMPMTLPNLTSLSVRSTQKGRTLLGCMESAHCCTKDVTVCDHACSHVTGHVTTVYPDFWQSLLKLKAHCSTMSRVRRLTLSNAITGSLFMAKADHFFCVRGRGPEGRE